MKFRILFALILTLIAGLPARAERILFAAFDVSATAFEGHADPYDSSWHDLLQTVHGGDHVFAAVVNERGLANGAPTIDFTIRPFNILYDQSRVYDAAVQKKLQGQERSLDEALKNTPPARGTELIGLLHQAAKILSAYPRAAKQIVIYTDGIQEGREVDLADKRLSDAEIGKIVETERHAGRLPALSGASVWFVTGPSLHGQIDTNGLLRLEAFWTQFVQASGGKLKAFSPVLANFGHDSQ